MDDRGRSQILSPQRPQRPRAPDTRTPGTHPWTLVALAAAGVAALVLLVGVATGWLGEPADVAASPERFAAHGPPQQVIDDCNRFATEARQDAATGAEEGAGAASSAGAAGTLFGLSEESRRSRAARDAYRECMARRGY